MPSPIEPATRLRHRLFTPRVGRPFPVNDVFDDSVSQHQTEEAALDPDVLAILNDNGDDEWVDNADPVPNVDSLNKKKTTPTRRPKSKAAFEFENCLPKSEAIFQLQRFTGMTLAKDAEPALMEAIKQFNVLSIRFIIVSNSRSNLNSPFAFYSHI
jgi:hypothetical protein